MSLSPAATALLATLTKRGAKPFPQDQAAAEELAALGLAAWKAGRGSTAASLFLTDSGAETKKALPDAAKKAAKGEAKAPRAASPKAATTADLAALEERLVARFEALLARRFADSPKTPGLAASRAEAAELAPLAERILAETRVLEVRHGRLVPLAELRSALSEVPRAEVDAALFALEKERRLYLRIANDPLAVPSPEEGIRVAGRGLVYYAAVP